MKGDIQYGIPSIEVMKGFCRDDETNITIMSSMDPIEIDIKHMPSSTCTSSNLCRFEVATPHEWKTKTETDLYFCQEYAKIDES